MKQLNWYQIFGKSNIPDGRTVLPTDDIQIWLNCANIWDKTYTTLAEVLADTDTLLALITSDNAVDYMVRSTTWASGVSADSLAMTYIGQNNYCANTLLADATWCNAICNSEYFESVLNVKVPVMTSNTTPSGEVITSGAHSNGPAYYAFDGNNSTMYQSSSYDVSHYIGYVYPANIKCLKILATIQNGAASAQTMQGKIQVSSDGITWNDIGSWSFSNVPWSEDRNISFIVSDYSIPNYRYFRFLRTMGGDRFRVRNAQFYGREDV